MVDRSETKSSSGVGKSASFIFSFRGGGTRVGVGSSSAVASCLGGDGDRTPLVPLLHLCNHVLLLPQLWLFRDPFLFMLFCFQFEYFWSRRSSRNPLLPILSVI